MLESMMLLAALWATPPVATPATLVVQVGPLEGSEGQVGCLLFSGERGFPSDPSAAKARETHPARGRFVTCTFAGLTAGDYAVSVMHDADGDGELDTNFLGIPSEGYGASNNELPSMSAPTYARARVSVAAGETKKLQVTVKY